MTNKKPAQPPEPSPALHAIIERAEHLARARRTLGALVDALNQGVEALKADHLPDIRQAVDSAAAAWKELEEHLQAHPELFVKPRSMEAHGVKFGYAKGKGGLEIADPDRTVALIRKHLPDQADVLITVREAPVKDALQQLSAAELKKLGVEVKDTGDTVFIKPADGAVDKLVKALVASATEAE